MTPLAGTRNARAGALAVGVALLLTAAVGCSATEPSASGSSPAGSASPAPAGSTPAGSIVEAVRYPGAAWDRADPADVGLEAGPLDELAARLDAAESHCFVVVKDGRVVYEDTWRGFEGDTPQEIFSASKSFTSTLVGIAQEEGYLDIDQPASDFLTEWQGTPSEAVTIRDLLSNDSGRHYDFQTDYLEMAVGAEDKTGFALALDQQHDPGTVWEYNNSAIQTLEAVLERATGQDMEAYAIDHLFRPIGMDATIARDGAGNPLAFMGVRSSCEDLARFGYLFLHDGRWEDTQVVPADWVEEATHSSQQLKPGYGFLWWLFGDRAQPAAGADAPPGTESASSRLGSEAGGTDVPDSFAALGLGGQIVWVVPDEDLVVVRTGGSGGTDVSGQGKLLVDIAELTRAAQGL